MSIDLHCPQCRKLIRAPDGAGGKSGKCPHCKSSVYIPMPPDDDEEIRIAPISSDEERRDEELKEESARYTASLSHVSNRDASAGADGSPLPSGGIADAKDDVEAFILAMHASKLEEASAASARLKRGGSGVRDQIKDLLDDETPPQFGNVPQPLVKGFLKKLLSELG